MIVFEHVSFKANCLCPTDCWKSIPWHWQTMILVHAGVALNHSRSSTDARTLPGVGLKVSHWPCFYSPWPSLRPWPVQVGEEGHCLQNHGPTTKTPTLVRLTHSSSHGTSVGAADWLGSKIGDRPTWNSGKWSKVENLLSPWLLINNMLTLPKMGSW